MGAVVEAKTPDGQFMEGVITKLTDASVYTVGKHDWIFSLYLSFIYREESSSKPKHVLNCVCLLFFFQVFDDGDERTLRRTSLCLKGGRHFNESEVCSDWKIIMPTCLFHCCVTDQWSIPKVTTTLFLFSLQTLDHLPLTDPENFGTPVVQVNIQLLPSKNNFKNMLRNVL